MAMVEYVYIYCLVTLLISIPNVCICSESFGDLSYDQQEYSYSPQPSTLLSLLQRHYNRHHHHHSNAFRDDYSDHYSGSDVEEEIVPDTKEEIAAKFDSIIQLLSTKKEEILRGYRATNRAGQQYLKDQLLILTRSVSDLAHPQASGDDDPQETLMRYLSLPGYTVKMNELVFSRFINVLADLYGFHPEGFRDGKESIELLRQALKEEARFFWKREKSTFIQLVRKKIRKEYKYEILKWLAHETPVVGHALRVAVAVYQYEPTARKAFKKQWQDRKIWGKGYVALEEETQVGYGEPFSLFVLQHFQESDPNSIYNVNLRKVLTTPPKPPKFEWVVNGRGDYEGIDGVLQKSPGQCVIWRSDGFLVTKKRWYQFEGLRNLYAIGKNSVPCVTHGYGECMRQWMVENRDCRWQYCKVAFDPFGLVPHAECAKLDEKQCGERKEQDGKCEWGLLDVFPRQQLYAGLPTVSEGADFS